MLELLMGSPGADAAALLLASVLSTAKNYFLVFVGFSLVIFFHELGHFLAAKALDVRVDKFAVGFGRALFGFTRGETRYAFNVLPLGGYVKMLGQEDFAIDKSGELMVKDDPRAFTHKPVGRRMIIVSAGVIMNLVFSALLFMLVFMIGTYFPPAVVGSLKMESPAERAGLQPGDKIVRVNDQEIADFADLGAAVRLSAPGEPMTIAFERRDTPDAAPTRHTIKVEPEYNPDRNILELGVAPSLTNTVADTRDDPALALEDQLRSGDKILKVDGQEVSSIWEIIVALVRRQGGFATLEVSRAKPDGTSEIREVKRRVYRAFRPTGDAREESGHLLGLVPRRRIGLVNAAERAELAGLKAGDVIIRWGNQNAPTIGEILDSVAANSERDIRVEVLRRPPGQSWQIVSAVVRPKPQGLFRRGKPTVGMSFDGQEDDLLIVADIITNVTDDIATPAAPLKDIMPRGSRITKVNDSPVANWRELAERFLELAGSEVRLAWRYQEQPERSATIRVPHTLGTTFGLPPDHRITRINGRADIVIERDGKLVRYAAENWIGAREILRECIGQTIEVEHRPVLTPDSQTERIEKVTEEMLDTWVMRIGFQMDDMVTEMTMSRVQQLNPFKAMMIGIRKTYYFIEQVYLMMQRMVITRSVGFEQVSGPVGIVKLGSDIAERDTVKLLYFLALISANLAVINFLPLPIVDGGLFVFLIIEKIKGSPIPIKAQIATQLIGLALIIGVFLYVTLNDIQKLFG